MKSPKYTCDGCKRPRHIWKNVSENGRRLRFCSVCWSCRKQKHKPTRKSSPRPRSLKRQKQGKEYSALRGEFLMLHPHCQAALTGCLRHASEIHHKKGRIGELYLDTTAWLSCCHSCHVWIELHPREAKELGLSQSRDL